jgi:hypothetical protein
MSQRQMSPPPPEGATQPRKPRRIFMWVFLAIQVVFVYWVFVGSRSGDDKACADLTGDALKLCQDAGDVGTFIGVGMIVGVWVAVDLILGISYAVYRFARR